MGLVLFDPTDQGTRAADYPWAPTTEEWRHQLAVVRAGWGDRAYLEGLAQEWAPEVASDEAFRRLVRLAHASEPEPGRRRDGVQDRDGARRGRRPRRRPRPDAHPASAIAPGPAHYAAERIRGSELVDLPSIDGVYTWVDDEAHQATMAETARFVARLTDAASHRARARDRPVHRHRRLHASSPLASGTRPGVSCSSAITRSFAGSSPGSMGESSTPPGMGSSPPSMDRPAASRQPPRSASRCGPSASRSGPASTPASSRSATARSSGSPCRSARGSRRSPDRARCSCRAP